MTLKALKEAAERATPGKWHAPGLCEVHAADHTIVAETFGFNDPEDDLPQGQHELNANFIAAANPATVLALIAALERAEAQYWELRGVIIDVEEGGGFDDVCLATIKRVASELAALSDIRKIKGEQ